MKALTIWQPWASLIACGAKIYETRSWETSYRGTITIHAAAKSYKSVIRELFPMGDEIYNPDREKFENALKKAFSFENFSISLNDLPRGAIIATAELVGCRLIEKSPILGTGYFMQGCFREIKGDELLFGDWTPGRYAWELRNVKALDKPIPAKGQQGLWNCG